MKCWAWIDSGECVDAPTKLDAYRLLRENNPGCSIDLEDVLEEKDAHHYMKLIYPEWYAWYDNSAEIL